MQRRGVVRDLLFVSLFPDGDVLTYTYSARGVSWIMFDADMIREHVGANAMTQWDCGSWERNPSMLVRHRSSATPLMPQESLCWWETKKIQHEQNLVRPNGEGGSPYVVRRPSIGSPIQGMPPDRARIMELGLFIEYPDGTSDFTHFRADTIKALYLEEQVAMDLISARNLDQEWTWPNWEMNPCAVCMLGANNDIALIGQYNYRQFPRKLYTDGNRVDHDESQSRNF